MGGERRFRFAFIGACLVHAALLLLVASRHCTFSVPRSRPIEVPLVGIELALSSEAASRVSSNDQQALVAGQRGQPAVDVPTVRQDATGAQPDTEATGSDTAISTLTAIAPPEGSQDSKLTPSESSGDSAAGKARRLSRVAPRPSGAGDDFALAYAMSQQEKAPSQAATAADRLRQSMQQDVADADRELGLRLPAPLILALEAAARDVAIPTNSIAMFTANIDGSGNLLGLEYAGSDHASPQWNKLTERVEQALRGRKLSIAKNTKGVDFKLRLVARSQLPSGRDPGLEVDLFGAPIKRGQGKRSSKIGILTLKPEISEFEVPCETCDENQKVKIPVPRIVFNLLEASADPSDIGAPARHMIRVQVVEEKIY